MTVRAFRIKEGDTSPPVFATLLEPTTGDLVDLTGASVRFHMADEAGAVVVDEPAFILNGGVTGGVRFDAWTAAHTSQAGRYLGEFEVTFPDGDIASYPVEKAGFPILIVRALA